MNILNKCKFIVKEKKSWDCTFKFSFIPKECHNSSITWSRSPWRPQPSSPGKTTAWRETELRRERIWQNLTNCANLTNLAKLNKLCDKGSSATGATWRRRLGRVTGSRLGRRRWRQLARTYRTAAPKHKGWWHKVSPGHKGWWHKRFKSIKACIKNPFQTLSAKHKIKEVWTALLFSLHCRLILMFLGRAGKLDRRLKTTAGP